MPFNRAEYQREWMRNWRCANPEKERERKRKYYQRNKEKVLAAWGAWKAANPQKAKAQQARRRTKKASEKLRLATKPKPDNCELCGKATQVHFDHCHRSGRFRGWLCFQCNTALGLANDDTDLLKKMIQYLDASNAV